MTIDLAYALPRLADVLSNEEIHKEPAHGHVKKSETRRLLKYPCSEEVGVVHADHRIFVRKNSPLLLGNGDNQLTIQLGKGLVAKMLHTPKEDIPTHHVVMHEYDAPLQKTYELLKQHSFPILEHAFVVRPRIVLGHPIPSFDVARKYEFLIAEPTQDFSVILTEDLTDGGRCEVVDVTEESFMKAGFFSGLQEQYRQVVKELLDLQREYIVTANSHQKNGDLPVDLQYVVQRSFLLVIDKQNKFGRLVLGDVDNIRVRKKQLP